jgi:glycosyltransferase involved in cell wall biosynthesis
VVVCLSNTLHISFVTETYIPEINGVAMTLKHLVDGVQTRGHRVTLFRPRRGSADQPAMSSRYAEHLVPGFSIPVYKELRIGMPAGERLSMQWKKDRPDAVYIATEGPLGWSAARTANTLRIPTLSGFHTNFHIYSKHYGLSWLKPVIVKYLRTLHRNTGCTVVSTATAAADLNNHDYNCVEILQRGVDTHLFNPNRRNAGLRKQWGLSDTDLACLYVGRIAAEKNIAEAIAAFIEIRKSTAAKLILVGDGPMRKRLQRQHPDVIFCGAKRGAELAEHYASGDVFLFPSQSETFGNVVTEAMASGLAVVAYDQAAAHEHIISGHNGMLVSVGTQPDFSTTASQLCTQATKIAALGQAAAEYARTLSWTDIVTGFVALLERRIGPAGRSCKC